MQRCCGSALILWVLADPGDSGSGYTLLTEEATSGRPCKSEWEAQNYTSKAECIWDFNHGTQSGNSKEGSMVEFMRSIRADAGFTWERVEVSQDSKELFDSSFTACVHAVAVGQTDMYDAVAFSICVHACNLNRASTCQVHRQLLGDLGPNVGPPDVYVHGLR